MTITKNLGMLNGKNRRSFSGTNLIANTGTSFIEIYQNCIVFIDGAFAGFVGKKAPQDADMAQAWRTDDLRQWQEGIAAQSRAFAA
jgi:hypothetical protein